MSSAKVNHLAQASASIKGIMHFPLGAPASIPEKIACEIDQDNFHAIKVHFLEKMRKETYQAVQFQCKR